MKRFLLTLMVLAAVPFGAIAHDYTLKTLQIQHPMARVGRTNTMLAVGMTIKNSGGADKLVAVSTTAPMQAAMHTMAVDANGVMKMRETPSFDIPANGEKVLGGHGDHIMLVNLQKAAVAGDKFPLTLTFEKAGAVAVEVNVESLDAPTQEMAPEHHDMEGMDHE